MNLIKFIVLVLVFFVCTYSYADSLWRVELTRYRLGTRIQLVVYHDDTTFAHIKLQESVRVIDSMNHIFSDYEESSELNKLSRSSGSGKSFRVSGHLFSVIDTALYISTQTDGAFDITCGPITHLWRQKRRKDKIPSKKRVETKLRSVGYELVKLDANTRSVRLSKRNMQLDAGGIAKGYIADVVGNFLIKEGLPRYMIDMGGDMVVGLPPPGKPGWSIQIPGKGVIHLSQTAVATSGPDFQFTLYKSKVYSHIVDPRTGWGLTNPRTVTVVNNSGLMADALASAFSVLTLPESVEKLNLFENTGVYIKGREEEFVSKEFPVISY